MDPMVFQFIGDTVKNATDVFVTPAATNLMRIWRNTLIFGDMANTVSKGKTAVSPITATSHTWAVPLLWRNCFDRAILKECKWEECSYDHASYYTFR